LVNSTSSQSSRPEQFAAWLSAIATAGSPSSVHRLAAQAAIQLTGAGGAMFLRPDDHGFLDVVESLPSSAPIELVLVAASSLHHRWIAAHGSSSTDATPFGAEDHPELLVAPLMVGDRLIGGIAIVRATEIDAVDSICLAAIASTAAQTIEQLQLRQRLDLAITNADLEIELSKARKEIARELHDGPAQELALTGYTIDRISMQLGPDHPSFADAREAREMIDRSIYSIRTAIGNARNPQAAAPSLTGPLRDLISSIDPPAPEMNVRFEDVSGLQLVPEVERAMVGIVREALHNVRQHAQADSVRLDVRRVNDMIELSVTDDGVGISRDAAEGHFGLEQIRELAEETGGRIEISKTVVNGTSVRAWIPLPAAGAARIGSSPLTPRAPGQARPAHLSLVPQEANRDR
jgi:signal transduction histidine kinase